MGTRGRAGRALISVAAAVAARLALVTSASVGATTNWTNSAGGNYNDPANWNNGAGPVPSSSDTAQLALASTYAVTFPDNATTTGLTVSAGNVSLVTDGSPRTFTAPTTVISNGASLLLNDAAATI